MLELPKRRMKLYVGPFFKFTKYCLILFGLWPYQSTFSNRIRNSFFGVFTISAMIPMVLGLNQRSSVDIVIYAETMSAIIMIFGAFVQSTTMYLQQTLVRELIQKIHWDWAKIHDEREIAILRKFFYQARKMAIVFTVFSISSCILFLIITYLSQLTDIKTSRNPSQFFPYYSDYWIIGETTSKLQLFIHSSLGILHGTIVYVIVMTTYICSVKHVCGMYAIVGYRLRKLMESQVERTSANESETVRKLLSIVVKHRETIEGTQMITRLFGTAFFIVEICLLICIALFIFDIKYNINDFRLVSKILLIVVSFIIYIFQVNYGGEEVIQFSNQVYLSIYSIQWYLASTKVRKILLMILLRSHKPDVILASIMKLSLENFVTIIKGSWSLATIIIGKNN